MKKVKLNEASKRILNELIQNPRKSYRELAKSAKVSIVTIANKMKMFQEQNIIRRFATHPNYDLLGYSMHVLIQIKVLHGQEVKIEEKLTPHPNVHGIYDITGDYDVLVIARFKNRRDLDTFIKMLQKLEFIERTKTSLILRTMKEGPIHI